MDRSSIRTRSSLMSKRVLIMSVSGGTDHINAAESPENAFAAGDRVAAVIHKDARESMNQLFRNLYSRFYTQRVRSAPNFLGRRY